MVMASSGMLLVAFLAVHAFGNAAIYMGGDYFQLYADTLHSFPVLVWLFGFGLVVLPFSLTLQLPSCSILRASRSEHQDIMFRQE